ncbi:MAG: beta-propeller fold lactonase family protein [Gemmatimonadaceae bacterium]
MKFRALFSVLVWPAAAALALASCNTERTPVAPDDTKMGDRQSDVIAADVESVTGAVYTMSNDLAGNRIVVYRRALDGSLTLVGDVDAGGRGSGAFEDSDNALILGDADGESAPNNLTEARKLLFAVNAGTNTVVSFRVTGDGTTLVQASLQASGGRRPVSLTVNHGLLYVLNSGERILGLSAANCTTGDLPSVSGFRVAATGELTPIAGSKRQLSGQSRSGCAQASFTADGKFLIVTERLAKLASQSGMDEGTIDVFPVNADGTLGTPRIIDATGRGPFGFTPTRSGSLLVTEQFGGAGNPGGGAAAGYTVNADGTLTPGSSSIFNGGTDTCWIIVSDDGAYAYAVSFFGTGRISTYAVGAGGALTLLDATDDDGNAGTGASDVSLSANSKFLYQLNSVSGKVNSYQIGSTGRLTFLSAVQAHAASPAAARIGLAAF